MTDETTSIHDSPTRRPRPVTLPPSRWDDPTCGNPDCECTHGAYPNGDCDRGFVRARPQAVTPGTGPTGSLHVADPASAVSHCPVCATYAPKRRSDAGGPIR